MLPTPLGDVAPTGRPVDIVTIDVLTLQPDGRVSEIWVLSDQLGLLLGLDALALSAPAAPTSMAD
jgi:hypothetical protein